VGIGREEFIDEDPPGFGPVGVLIARIDIDRGIIPFKLLDEQLIGNAVPLQSGSQDIWRGIHDPVIGGTFETFKGTEPAFGIFHRDKTSFQIWVEPKPKTRNGYGESSEGRY
jgi:hypothetical protein